MLVVAGWRCRMRPCRNECRGARLVKVGRYLVISNFNHSGMVVMFSSFMSVFETCGRAYHCVGLVLCIAQTMILPRRRMRSGATIQWSGSFGLCFGVAGANFSAVFQRDGRRRSACEWVKHAADKGSSTRFRSTKPAWRRDLCECGLSATIYAFAHRPDGDQEGARSPREIHLQLVGVRGAGSKPPCRPCRAACASAGIWMNTAANIIYHCKDGHCLPDRHSEIWRR
jgi:hypothetical protein